MKKILPILVLTAVLAVPIVALAAKPTVTTVDLEPANPTTNDELKATWDYDDGDNDAQKDTEVGWYKDGGLEATHNVSGAVYEDILAPGATKVGEKWLVKVKPCDNTNICADDPVTSNEVVIAAAGGPGVGGPSEGVPAGLSPCSMKHNIKGCDEAKGAEGVECSKEKTEDCDPKADGKCCHLEACCLLDIIYTVVDWIFVVLLVIAGIFILWGGIEFITSGGDPEKVAGARNKLIWALVGVVVAFISKGLVALITQIIKK